MKAYIPAYQLSRLRVNSDSNNLRLKVKSFEVQIWNSHLHHDAHESLLGIRKHALLVGGYSNTLVHKQKPRQPIRVQSGSEGGLQVLV